MNKFFKAFATVTIISIATRALCFLFKIFLSRTLSLETLGSYQIASGVFMVAVAVVSSGLPITLSRDVASASGDRLLSNKKATSTFFLAVLFSLVSCTALLIISPFLSEAGEFLQIACFSLLFLGVYSTSRGYLWGRKEFFSFSFLELIEEVATIFFAFLVFKLELFDSELSNLAFAFVLASILCGVLGIFQFKAKGGTFVYSGNLTGKILKSSSFITTMRIIGTAFASIYTICLPIFLQKSGYTTAESLAVVGLFYGMVVPLLFIPSTLVSGLSLVLVPEVAQMAQNKAQVAKTISFAIRFAMLFAVVFLPFYIVFASEITTFLFVNSESGEMLKISAIAVLPISLNMLLSGFLNSLGLEKRNFIHFFCSGVLCFLLLYPAVQIFGENAIIFTFALQPTIPAILNLALLKKHCEIPVSEIAKSLSPALLFLPSLVIAIFLKSATTALPTFISLATSGLAIFLFCLAVFYVAFFPTKKPI